MRLCPDHLFTMAGVLGWGILRAGAALVEPAWSAEQTTAGATGHEASGLSLDAAGNVFLAGQSYFTGTSWDIVLAKYSATGTKLWERSHDDSGQLDLAAAVSAWGNVIHVAGSVLSVSSGFDLILLKYDTNGSLLWQRRHDGPAHLADLAVSLAVDADGHAIVAGNSDDPITGRDVIVIKYDPDGNRLWDYRRDGPGHADDRVVAMKLDGSGNILVVGASSEQDGEIALITLKLSPDGQLLWTANSPAPPASYIEAADVDVDGAGNVVTVGTDRWEFLTLKYTPDGALLWQARYRANEPAGMLARAVRAHPSGEITAEGDLFGSGTNDTILVHYDAAGNQLWTSRVVSGDGPFHAFGFTIDSAGASYVTGEDYPDILTVKIGADGNRLWTARHNTTQNLIDYGLFIATDVANDVVVAGRSVYFGNNLLPIVKYRQQLVPGTPTAMISPASQSVLPGTEVTLTATGTGEAPLQFQWRFNGRPLHGATGPTLALGAVQAVHGGDYSVYVSNSRGAAVSPEARVVVLEAPTVLVEPAEQSSQRGAQAGFVAHATGTAPFRFQWRRGDLDLPGATNASLFLADLGSADAGAYTVVVTSPAGSVTSGPATLSLLTDVRPFRHSLHNGPGNGPDQGRLLQFTPAGDIVIAGVGSGPSTGPDIVLLKYQPDGQLLWRAALNRAGSDPDEPTDLAVDSTGNLYLAGGSGQAFANRVFTTAKYSPHGQPLWVRHYQDGAATENLVTALAVDPEGRVTVAGVAWPALVAIRYDPDGTELWRHRLETAGYDTRAGVAVDETGHSYLAGTRVENEEPVFLLRKLDPAGDILWTRTFHPGSATVLTRMTRDPAGNLILVGRAWTGSDPPQSGVLLKVSPDGALVWQTIFGGAYDFPRALVVDANGIITVAASVENNDDDELGTRVLRFGAAGGLMWETFHPTFEIENDARIALDSAGSVYLAGRAGRAASGPDAATVKYDADGCLAWQAHHTSPGTRGDCGLAVAVNDCGDVHMTGAAAAPLGQGSDLLWLVYLQPQPLPSCRLEIRRTPQGGFELVLPTAAELTLEASTDLIHWQPVPVAEAEAAVSATGGTAAAAPPHQFYRLARFAP